MKLARVIGKIVLSKQIGDYDQMPLHLIQDLNDELEPVGEPAVVATWQAMEEGDLVVVEVAREAANAFSPPLPVDAVIIARADSVDVEKVDH